MTTSRRKTAERFREGDMICLRFLLEVGTIHNEEVGHIYTLLSYDPPSERQQASVSSGKILKHGMGGQMLE